MSKITGIRKFYLFKQMGVTLLEALLFLAIAGSILVLGLRQYNQYKAQQDLQQLQLIIDSLFVALGYYYQANCASFPSTSPQSVTPATLVAQGFLSTNWNSITVPFAISYVTQFNKNATTGTMNVWACSGSGTTYTCNASQPLPTASVTNWTAQVAVEVSTSSTATSLAKAYHVALSADCLSNLSGATVTPCTTSSTGNYLVWTRLPSLAAPNIKSDLWTSMPQLKEFNMQYTHDQMYELSNGAQPYICGN